jgi:hypothetical protein
MSCLPALSLSCRLFSASSFVLVLSNYTPRSHSSLRTETSIAPPSSQHCGGDSVVACRNWLCTTSIGRPTGNPASQLIVQRDQAPFGGGISLKSSQTVPTSFIAIVCTDDEVNSVLLEAGGDRKLRYAPTLSLSQLRDLTNAVNKLRIFQWS